MPMREVGTFETWEDGIAFLSKYTDNGENRECLWRALGGCSRGRGKKKWVCTGHEGCTVELTLQKQEEERCVLIVGPQEHADLDATQRCDLLQSAPELEDITEDIMQDQP